MADIDGISSLAARANDGDARAADELLRVLRPEVVRIARHYDLPGGSHEDLVQEGMIGVWCALPAFEPERGPFRELALVAARRAIQKSVKRALRRRHAEARTIALETPDLSREGQRLLDRLRSPDPPVGTALFGAEGNRDMMAKLQRLLTPSQFEVVAPRLEGTPCAEIARRLDLPLDAVESRWWRAKARIRSAWDEGELTLG